MKRIVFALLVVAAVAVLAPRSASAQTAPALFKAPFNFIVGDALLPAGDYRIASDTQDPTLLVITNAKGKPAAFAAAGRADGTPGDSQVHVAFKNVDGQYFLWRVAMPGSDSREIVVTKARAERALAKLNLLPAEHADVAK